jgi:hypothetical protein
MAQKEITKMTTFTIDTDNNITAFATTGEATASNSAADLFASQKELLRLAGCMPFRNATFLLYFAECPCS